MERIDHYAVLGVARDATAEQIKKAYRQLARRFHPDVNRTPDAARRMSEVNEAYAVLSDPERRAAHDATLRRGFEGFSAPPPGWEPGVDAEDDFFTDLFSRLRDRVPGHDLRSRITLSLEEAWRGARVSLRVGQRTLEVALPAGVRPGQVIRLAGQGGAGGDLLLEVALRAHPRWRLAGDGALQGELPLAPWEAALGAVVPLQLPDGKALKVRVPAGAQPGQVITVRGKGWPGQVPGDLELRLQVVLPSALDPRAKRLYEQMAAALPDFDARRVAAADAERTA